MKNILMLLLISIVFISCQPSRSEMHSRINQEKSSRVNILKTGLTYSIIEVDGCQYLSKEGLVHLQTCPNQIHIKTGER